MVEYYLATGSSEVLSFGTAWIEVEIMRLTETQHAKDEKWDEHSTYVKSRTVKFVRAEKRLVPDRG